MSTWILREAASGPGLRVAVKDLIDVAGLPTTAGSRAVADQATPAAADAPCLAGLRAAIGRGQACLVGKTNLHELAYGISGINSAFGTPVNPLDPLRVPGGSSSGSAVAVASGEADVAYGSDTGGSIRIPGRVLRDRRPEDHLGPDTPRRRVAARAEHGHRRADGPGRGGPDRRDGTAGAGVLGRGRGAPGRRAGRDRGDPIIDRAVDAALAAAGGRWSRSAWTGSTRRPSPP